MVAAAFAASLSAPRAEAQTSEVLVFAAASQRDALEAAIDAYGEAGKGAVKASYQSSGTLARQIELGAPADLYISANPKWMDYLAERKLVDTGTRVNLLSNSLVLVAAKDSPAGQVETGKGFDLIALLGDDKLAVGDPAHVPAGIYARQALENLGLWSSVEAKLARADNVRAALALVARGEAPLGIVYASDAKADEDVEVIGRFPASTHEKIIYPAAVTTLTANPEAARAFLAFLQSPEAVKIYKQYGFEVLK